MEDERRRGRMAIRTRLIDTRAPKLEPESAIEGIGRCLRLLEAVSPGWTRSIPVDACVMDEIERQRVRRVLP